MKVDKSRIGRAAEACVCVCMYVCVCVHLRASYCGGVDLAFKMCSFIGVVFVVASVSIIFHIHTYVYHMSVSHLAAMRANPCQSFSL